MFDETKTPLIKFSTEINEKGELSIPYEKLKSLKEKGFKNVEVIIMGDSDQALQLNNIDPVLFKLIKEKQGIPDTAVLDFIHSKGSLADSKLDERINY